MNPCTCVPAPRHIRDQEQPRGCTPRTDALAWEAVNRQYSAFGQQRRLQADFQPQPGLSQVLEEAHRFAYVHTRLTPVIHPRELIVGARLRQGEGGFSWLPSGDVDYIGHYAANAPGCADTAAMARRGLFSPQGSFNHKVVDYAGFIATGAKHLIDRSSYIAAQTSGEAHDVAQAFILCHQAIIDHAQNYAQACAALARQTADPIRQQELLEIEAICRRVPANPASTFREALQSLWFAYMVAGDGTGRVDTYLAPYYERDRQQGRITRIEALELIECFLIKLHGDYPEGIINVSSVQTLTLGGLLPNGEDGTHPLTYLFLEGVRNLRLLRPSIYLRVHERTPRPLLVQAVTMLSEGLSQPCFFGDRPVIDGLRRLGLPLAQARDYALSGCAEVVSPGKGNWGAPNGWINLALLVDEAIQQCPSETVTAKTLWEAVGTHMDAVVDACREANQWVDDQNTAALVEATIMMPVCLERGSDIHHGGAQSYMGHWEAVGLPNAADMLFAVEQLVLNQGMPLGELLAKVNAQDHSTLARLQALPHFGNNHEHVDTIAARLVAMLQARFEAQHTTRRQVLTLGHLAGGENMHIAYGASMGPTLDGRRPGQPLADSLAGSQGYTRQGPTAVLSSLCAIDHSHLIAGSVSTLRMNPEDVATPSGIAKVVALLQAYVLMGGSQLQLNIVDAATLRAAQADPDQHRGLMVRVAGYSADFTGLGKIVQDEIIARTSTPNSDQEGTV